MISSKNVDNLTQVFTDVLCREVCLCDDRLGMVQYVDEKSSKGQQLTVDLSTDVMSLLRQSLVLSAAINEVENNNSQSAM